MQKREARAERRQRGGGRNCPAQLPLRELRVGDAEEESEIKKGAARWWKKLPSAAAGCCYERAE